MKNGLSDLLPSAYEGMARAYAQPQLARAYIVKVHRESITDKEDKKIYADQINETESLLQLK